MSASSSWRSASGVLRSSRALLVLVLLAMLGVAAVAEAHDFRPALLRLVEQSDAGGQGSGRFGLRMVVPPLGSEGPIPEGALEPLFPAHCERAATQVDCGSQGLVGTIFVDGLERYPVDVIVDVHFADGTQLTTTLGPDEPFVELGGSEQRTRVGSGSVAWTYLVLGIEHILAGFDHLLFVLGLVLLVRDRRSLLWTITAFTVAHSITLAASSLALLSLPGPPVEAGIALSIVLLARELALEARGASRGEPPRDSLSFRRPYLVAFVFGLLHGFGFAGALAEVGLPTSELPLALLTFNLGVEVGQLGVVGVLSVLIAGARALAKRLGARDGVRSWAKVLPVYVMGTLACAWLLERVLAWF